VKLTFVIAVQTGIQNSFVLPKRCGSRRGIQTLRMPCNCGSNTNSKSKMISRRLGRGDEAYYIYVEEADDDANKDSALI
jgi:hypothetical protein